MTSQFRTGAEGAPTDSTTKTARQARADMVDAMSRPTVVDQPAPAKPTRSATAKAARADWIESFKKPRNA